MIKKFSTFIAIIFISGCGLYDATYEYGNGDTDFELSNFETCEMKCCNICNSCYYWNFSVNSCELDCNSGCMNRMCYANLYSSACSVYFQDLCNGQYD